MFGLNSVLPNATRQSWRLVKRHGQVMSMCTQVMLFSMAALHYSGAWAAPEGGTVVSGSATIEQVGTTTNITQLTPNVQINWTSFNVGVNEQVNFLNQTTSSIALNTVINGLPTTIQGTITGLGTIVIHNPAGITLTDTARMQIGALMLSALQNLKLTADNRIETWGGGNASIVNKGDIRVSDGGWAVLVAPHVENSGTIVANLGEVQLASASAATIDLRGDGRITFTVDGETLNTLIAEGDKLGVDNSGTIQARSGIVALTAATASQIVQSVVNLGGVIDADAIAAGHNGGQVLVASKGDINITGTVTARGGVDGNGGQIITIADGSNFVNAGATLSVRGGDNAGNGGFIEVSGEHVLLAGNFDASAPAGAHGTVLIDPTILTVINGNGVPGADQVTEGQIESGAVTNLVADSQIIVQDIADNEITAGAFNLLFQTTGAEGGVGSIRFDDPNDTIRTTSGNITFSATGTAPHIDIGNLVSFNPDGSAGAVSVTTTNNGGNITVRNVASVGIGNEATTTASVSMSAAGSITVINDVFVAALETASFDDGVANASLAMTAGTGGDGILTVGGNTGVVAITHGDPFNDAEAEAWAQLRAKNSVFLGATANADYTVPGLLAGEIGSNAAGLVTTTNLLEETGLPTTTPPGLLPVAAPSVEVAALASSPEQVDFDGSKAKAWLEITSGWEGGAGSISIAGATDVRARATVLNNTGELFDANATGNEGLGNAKAKATAELTAYNGDVTTGDITVLADALVRLEGAIFVEGFGNETVFDQPLLGATDHRWQHGAEAESKLVINSYNGEEGIQTGALSSTAQARLLMIPPPAEGETPADDGGLFIGNFGSEGGFDVTVFKKGIINDAKAESELDLYASQGDIDVNGLSQSIANAHVLLDGGIHFEGINITSFGLSSEFTGVGWKNALGDATAKAKIRMDAPEGDIDLGGVTAVANATSRVLGGVTFDNISVQAFGFDEQGASAMFVGFNKGIVGETKAIAKVELTAGDSVDVRGQLTVQATALGEVDRIAMGVGSDESFLSVGAYGGSFSGTYAGFVGVNGYALGGSKAEAELVVSAFDVELGNAEGPGGVLVSASATDRVGEISVAGSVFADSFSDFGYGGSANAYLTGFANSLIGSNDKNYGEYEERWHGYSIGSAVKAEADIEISADSFAIIYNGLTETAAATVDIGPIGLFGVAQANGFGPVTPVATFLGFGRFYEGGLLEDEVNVLEMDRVSSRADLDIRAGEIIVNGDLTVDSAAKINVAEVNIGGLAFASGSGFGGYGGYAYVVGVTGDLVDIDQEDEVVTSAVTAELLASRGIEITGNATASSLAEVAVGPISIEGFASAFDENFVVLSSTGSFDTLSETANVLGGTSAGVLGIADDVVDGERILATAHMSLISEGGSEDSGGIVVGGDAQTSATARVTVGTIEVNGFASGIASYGGPIELSQIESGFGTGAAVYGIGSSVINVEEIVSTAMLDIYAGPGPDNAGHVTVGGTLGSHATSQAIAGDMTVVGQTFADGLPAYFSGIGGYEGGDLVDNEAIVAFSGVYVKAAESVTLGALNTSANAELLVGDRSATLTTNGGEAIGFSDPDIYTGYLFDGNVYVGDGGLDGFDESFVGGLVAVALNLIDGGNNSDSGDSHDVTILNGADTIANANGTVGSFSEMLNGEPAGYEAWLEGSAASLAYLRVRSGQTDLPFNYGHINVFDHLHTDSAATFDAGAGMFTYGAAFGVAGTLLDAAEDVNLDGTVFRSMGTAHTTGQYALGAAVFTAEAGERIGFAEGSYGGLVPFFLGIDGTNGGDINVVGDLYSFASAVATGDEFPEEGDLRNTEVALAQTNLSAHAADEFYGGPFGGSVIVNFLTPGGQPQAVAVTGSHGSSATDAVQSDLDATRASDTDGSPFTFIDFAANGSNFNLSLTSGEVWLPSDYASAGNLAATFLLNLVGFPGAEGSFATAAATVIHWHDEGIIRGPEGEAGVERFLITYLPIPNSEGGGKDQRLTPGPEDPPGAVASPAGTLTLGLLPGGSCSFGSDQFSIQNNGVVVFSPLFAAPQLDLVANTCTVNFVNAPGADSNF